MIYYNKWPVLIRTALAEDLKKMEHDLRPEDAEEVRASHGHTPGQALAYSFADAEMAFTYLYRGKPVALFGVTRSPTLDFASVWLLATTGLAESWLTFLRVSRYFIQVMSTNYQVLFNYVDARNAKSIRWLAWCGAKFDEPKPYGVAGLPFMYFTFEKENPHGSIHDNHRRGIREDHENHSHAQAQNPESQGALREGIYR